MRTCVATFSLILLAAGCGQPQFVNRAEFEELEPYARDYSRQVLETYFGSPTEMVVWDRLPLEAHLAQGRVTAAGERELTLDLAEPHREIAPGTEVVWVEGALEGEPGAWIREWDEQTHRAILEERLEALPEEGQVAILGPGQILARGRMLYAEHCQHCHGVTGDGAGPTAKYLDPRPRDYRRGIFKFTTTQSAERASRGDLVRIIQEGIPGTYMPSFKLLTDEEMTSIVEYVLWLSMRGEMEYQLVRYLSDGYSRGAIRDRIAGGETREEIRQEFIAGVEDPEEIPAELEMMVELMVSRWRSAQQPDALIAPTEHWRKPDPESIARGRRLYLSADLNCIACHGEAGYGDGPQTYTITKDQETGEDNPLPGLYDNWGNRVQPRNLYAGVFRGGRRPIDLYSRIHAGIKGTPMPSFGAKLEDQQIWDLVNYIYSVPYSEHVLGAGALEERPEEASGEGVASH